MQLILDQLGIGYDKSLCDDINLTLEVGSVYVLLGDNGLGKTTLFKTIAGIINPLFGSIKVQGGKKSGVAFVGTDKPQIDFLSVKEYLSFGQEQVSNETLFNLLNRFSMQGFVYQDVNDLSDGQFKKIALIRQLLKKKAVLLLDEPSAYLDVKNKAFLSDMLKSLKHNQVIFLSTHDVDFAKKCGDVFYKILNNSIIEISEF
ncbi:MAG: iron complex transport system ATP-binding protein [Saprospiraceae bacterium]|jgi:iron complex transport system ATP-binding protein